MNARRFPSAPATVLLAVLPLTIAFGGAGPAAAGPESSNTVTLFVELAATPGVDAFTGAQARGLQAAKESAQRASQQTDVVADRVLAAVRAKHPHVRDLGRTYNALSGVVLQVGSAAMNDLPELPDVEAVHQVQAPPQPNNDSKRQLTEVKKTGALDAWQKPGKTGLGVRIAIIDDGVDYTHADFGDDGTPVYGSIDKKKKTKFFPSKKVVGGHDFVGDGAGPDPNPLPCEGHGTHVAGIAAGYGVDSDGNTFTGKYAELTDTDVDDMWIGPGAAPEAQIYAYKIDGCNGAASYGHELGLALDRTLDPNQDKDFSDRIDVVNVSWGWPYGRADDPNNKIVRRLAKHGIVVVGSVGNKGDRYDVAGGVGSSQEAIGVANGHYRWNQIADSSSRGVRAPTLKPDVTAPGVEFKSAEVGTGALGVKLTGTSQSSPHVAGIAALVRQAHADWTSEEVKAAIMNTSGHNSPYEFTMDSPMRAGAGGVNAKAAVDNQVLAMNQDDPGAVSVSFGPVEIAERTSRTKTVKIVNKGKEKARFDVDYVPSTEVPGVKFAYPREVTVPPGGVTQVKVTLEIDDPAALRKTKDDKKQSARKSEEHFLAEASGRLKFAPTGEGLHHLHVPVYAAPKPVAALAADQLTFPAKGNQARLTMTGTGVDQGTDAERYQSLVSVFTLGASSPKLRDCGGKITKNCVGSASARAGDLRYVGAASTAPQTRAAGRGADAMLAFGIVTWADWPHLGDCLIPQVFIHVDSDGRTDYTIELARLKDSDLMVARTTNSAGEQISAEPINTKDGRTDTNAFDTNVIVLPVKLATLGIEPTAKTKRIAYHVAVKGGPEMPQHVPLNSFVNRVDVTEWALFDVLNPGLSASGTSGPALVHPVTSGTVLTVERDKTTNKTDKLLVTQHHNAAGNRAQILSVDEARPAT